MKTITPKHHNCRLDIYLANTLALSRASIIKAIKNKEILVNNNTTKPAYILTETDKIQLNIKKDTKQGLIPTPMPLDILYEDDHIIILNKPAGLTVHPAETTKEPTLVHGLLAYTNTLSNIGGNDRPGIVHRIDKDTEGLMIITKTNEAHKQLSDQFKTHQIEKKYYALVKGDIKKDQLTINKPLARDTKNRKKRTVVSTDHPNAKQAITHIKVIKRYGTKTLLDITIETGRTHQIRAHLESIHHPILGDPLYASKRHKSLSGQRLQAYHLSFFHPISKEPLSFTLPMSLVLI